MKNSDKKRSSPLGVFAILVAVAAVALTTVLILHTSYGFFG